MKKFFYSIKRTIALLIFVVMPVQLDAADFDLYSFGDGNYKYSVSENLGKVIYIDFWASWCGPCRTSMPIYEDIYSDYKEKDFILLAVNLDQVEIDALSFIETLNVSYPLLRGDGKVAKDFGVSAMPASIIVNRNGEIVHRHLGFRKGDEKKIRHWIEELL